MGTDSRRSKEDNNIELINKFWLDEANTGWLVSISHDSNVASFKITYGDLTIVQDAAKDQLTAIVIPAPSIHLLSNMSIGFKAEALSKDGELLYELTYPIKDNTVLTGEYNWYPVQ